MGAYLNCMSSPPLGATSRQRTFAHYGESMSALPPLFSAALAASLLSALAGCSTDGPTATAKAPGESAPATAVASPSATPTTGALKTNLAPARCEDLVSPAIAKQLAAFGTPTIEPPAGGEPIGAPLTVPVYAVTGSAPTTQVTDYLSCTWGAGDSRVDVLLAAVDPQSYDGFAADIRYWGYGVSETAEILIFSFDGHITNSAGKVVDNIGFSDHWTLRRSSMITVQVAPGSPDALQFAIAISNDIATIVGAR